MMLFYPHLFLYGALCYIYYSAVLIIVLCICSLYTLVWKDIYIFGLKLKSNRV